MTDAAITRPNGSTVSAAEWWKFTATGLLGVVVSVGFMWMSGLSNVVTRSQVREMIQTESPYSSDRGLINVRLEKSEQDADRLSSKVDAILDGQNRMSGQLIRLAEQVSALRDKDRHRPGGTAAETK